MKLVGLLLLGILVISFAVLLFTYDSYVNWGTSAKPDFFFGVSYGQNTTAQAKGLIDKVTDCRPPAIVETSCVLELIFGAPESEEDDTYNLRIKSRTVVRHWLAKLNPGLEFATNRRCGWITAGVDAFHPVHDVYVIVKYPKTHIHQEIPNIVFHNATGECQKIRVEPDLDEMAKLEEMWKAVLEKTVGKRFSPPPVTHNLFFPLQEKDSVFRHTIASWYADPEDFRDQLPADFWKDLG